MKRALPLLTALLLAPLGALPAAAPWWDNYPLIVQGASADETLALNGDVGFTSDQGDPSWGIYVQKTVANGNTPTLMQNAGLKFITCYEAPPPTSRLRCSPRRARHPPSP